MLKNSLMSSGIAESQKEEIMRAMFAGAGGQVADVDGKVLEWDWGDRTGIEMLVMGWYWGTAATFVYILGLLGLYLMFRCRISEVYLVFLSVGEQKLHAMKE